jgi:hypothetical protein
VLWGRGGHEFLHLLSGAQFTAGGVGLIRDSLETLHQLGLAAQFVEGAAIATGSRPWGSLIDGRSQARSS